MIEWFLSPKNDNQRDIAFAMKMFSANQIADSAIDRYLDADDKKLERARNELQIRESATRQGLDWRKYMTDDAAEEDKTNTQRAISALSRPKTVRESVAVSVSSPLHLGQLKSTASSAKGTIAQLMRDLKAGTMAADSKILRFATHL